MKSIFTFFLIMLFSCLASAQGDSVENDFARGVKKLTLEKYSEGEDATSGFDYLIYKNKTEIKKIRVIWNGGASSAPTVDDVYYQAGVPVLYVKLALAKRRYNAVAKGSLTALPVIEKFYLKDAKLVGWIEKGKSVSAADPRWQEKEKYALKFAKDTLELYASLKEGQ